MVISAIVTDCARCVLRCRNNNNNNENISVLTGFRRSRLYWRAHEGGFTLPLRGHYGRVQFCKVDFEHSFRELGRKVQFILPNK
jgi:hypothetical protein